MGHCRPYKPLPKITRNSLKLKGAIKKWIMAIMKILTIVGHTHRPRFPEPWRYPFFNEWAAAYIHGQFGELKFKKGASALINGKIATKEMTVAFVRLLRVCWKGHNS